MKKFAILALAAVGVMGTACAADPATQADTSAATSTESSLTAQQQQELASVRAATDKYHDVNVAVADGFVYEPVCVTMPDGGMGYHYLNFERLAAPPELTKPAILLYTDGDDGAKKLIGVEYFTPVIVGGAPWFAATPPPPPPESNPAPVLFGQTFDGPMPGHNPQMPWHYDLHVWVWAPNPSGMFYHVNPRVECPAP